MLTALGSLAAQHANRTQNTLKNVKQFLDYAMTNQDAIITYRSSKMILAAHTDASSLSITKALSHAGAISSYQKTMKYHKTMVQY